MIHQIATLPKKYTNVIVLNLFTKKVVESEIKQLMFAKAVRIRIRKDSNVAIRHVLVSLPRTCRNLCNWSAFLQLVHAMTDTL